MRVSCREGHRIWSATYDGDPNPVLALDTRVLSEQLGTLAGLQIVDVACGTGRWMIEAKSRGAEVTGIDFSPEMLAVAARKPELAERLILGDAGQLPCRSGVADLAICSMAINYFPFVERALAEMARIVRRGGRVVVSDFHPDAIASGWKRSFRAAGSSYEIDHQDLTIQRITEAAQLASLTPAWRYEAYFGLAEQELFRRARKQALFAEVSKHPALHIVCWAKL